MSPCCAKCGSPCQMKTDNFCLDCLMEYSEELNSLIMEDLYELDSSGLTHSLDCTCSRCFRERELKEILNF